MLHLPNYPQIIREDMRRHSMTIIEPSVLSNLSFTPDRWHRDSALGLGKKTVYMPVLRVIEQGRGYFRDLVKAIERVGLEPAVVVPLGEMPAILRHMGFGWDILPFCGEWVETWRR